MARGAALVKTEVNRGDCLEVMRTMEAASFDLVYLDPPFCTGVVQRSGTRAFSDQWADMKAYVAYMRERIEEVHRVLSPTGSILLHCDWRTCHRLRVELDDVFGADHIVNHLIWRYGLGGSSPKGFARKHDDILFYARGKTWFFEPPLVPATSNRLKGKTKKATDVLDVPAINNMAKERVGWPTQKPLALLELLVEACCPPGGRVLDPFCGSGTTLLAAQRTGRHAVGVDASEDAVAIAQARLAQA